MDSLIAAAARALDAYFIVGAEHGFTVSGHTVEVTGTCADCRALRPDAGP